MIDKSFVQFVIEVRDACNRYLDAKPVTVTLVEVPQKRERKPTVKGNPRCRCGHGFTVHEEPQNGADGKPKNICRGCEADGSKLGCPEFVKRGTLPGVAQAPTSVTVPHAATNVAMEFTAVELAIVAVLKANNGAWTAQQIAILAGYVQSGTFNSAIATLRDLGLIDGSPGLQLTDEGKKTAASAVIGARPRDARLLRERWGQKLGKCGARIIEILHDEKSVESASRLAELTRYVQSGTFNSMIAKMRRMGLIEEKLPLRLCKELS